MQALNRLRARPLDERIAGGEQVRDLGVPAGARARAGDRATRRRGVPSSPPRARRSTRRRAGGGALAARALPGPDASARGSCRAARSSRCGRRASGSACRYGPGASRAGRSPRARRAPRRGAQAAEAIEQALQLRVAERHTALAALARHGPALPRGAARPVAGDGRRRRSRSTRSGGSPSRRCSRRTPVTSRTRTGTCRRSPRRSGSRSPAAELSLDPSARVRRRARSAGRCRARARMRRARWRRRGGRGDPRAGRRRFGRGLGDVNGGEYHELRANPAPLPPPPPPLRRGRPHRHRGRRARSRRAAAPWVLVAPATPMATPAAGEAAVKEQYQCPMHPTHRPGPPGRLPDLRDEAREARRPAAGAAAAKAAAPRAPAKAQCQCPMHPSIVQDHPGDCPICGMKLVKVDGGPVTPTARPTGSPVEGLVTVTIDPARQQLIGLTIAPASEGRWAGPGARSAASRWTRRASTTST